MDEQRLHSPLICHVCYIIIPTIFFIYLFSLQISFFYLDLIYFLVVLGAAPSGYIFFALYIRKESYAAMFVCKS